MTTTIMTVDAFKKLTQTWFPRLINKPSQNADYNAIITALTSYQTTYQTSPSSSSEWSAIVQLRKAINNFLVHTSTDSIKYPGVRTLEHQVTDQQKAISNLVMVNLDSNDVHFAWLGKLGGIQQEYIKIWAKTNIDKIINIWYDPNAMLSYELSVRLKNQVYAENIRSSIYDDKEFKETIISKAILLQNEAYQAIIKDMATGLTFDQAAINFMVKRFNSVRSELEGIAETNRQSFTNLGQNNVQLKNINTLFANSSDSILADGSLKKYYFQELAMRGNLAAATDIVRLLALHSDGGLYLDVDLLPNLNGEIFHSLSNPDLDLARTQAIMNYFTENGLINKESRYKNTKYIDKLSEIDRGKINEDILNFVRKYPSASTDISIWFQSIGDISILPNMLVTENYKPLGITNGAIAANKNSNAVDTALKIIKRNYLALSDTGFDLTIPPDSRETLEKFTLALNQEGEKLGLPAQSSELSIFSNRGIKYRSDGLIENSKATIATSGPTVIKEVVIQEIGSSYYRSEQGGDGASPIFFSEVNINTEEEKKHSWVGGVKDGIYAEDTQYKNQIIIELPDTATGNSVETASRYLYQKHEGKTLWLKYNSITKQLETVAGTAVDLPPDSRIIVVGHGDNTKLGGLSAIELAGVLEAKFGTNNAVQRISLVGCNVGVTSDYPGALLQELSRNGKTVSDGITARSSLVQVDAFGQKWTAVIDPTTNNVGAWSNGNDGSSKIKVTLDAHGQVQSTPVIDDNGEVVRLDTLEPRAVSGTLDQLRVQGLQGLSSVSIDGIMVLPILLDALGVVGSNGALSEQDLYFSLESTDGSIEPTKVHFNREIFTQFFTDTHDAATLQQAAKLVKTILVANQNDTTKLFSISSDAGADSLASLYAKAIDDAVSSNGVVAADLVTKLQTVILNYQQQVLLDQFTEQFGLSDTPDTDTVDNLKRFAEQLSGVSADDLKALRARFPTLTDAQLIQKAAIEATQRSLQGNTQAEEVLKVGSWTAIDAANYLSTHDVLIGSTYDGININTSALENLVIHGSALDHIRLVAAIQRIDPDLAATITARLNESSDPTIRNLGESLSTRKVGTTPISDTVSTVGGDALGVFTTLISVKDVIGNWNQLSDTQKGLDIAGIVGGIATTTPISKAISSLFTTVGATLGEVGEAVKGGVLAVALAPVTFAAIGVQWQDFWKNDGNTNSLAYKSLVANTVITTVTTAAGIALSAVSLAASLGAIAATSILGTIAAAAGPIGVAIAAAGFIISGIVQGALQVAEYDKYFNSVGDKVAQFFAAWFGIQTGGLLIAIAAQQGEQDATRQQKSLTDQWATTKQYLSDVFSKDGYKTLNVSERTYSVASAVVDQSGVTFSYLLQSSATYSSGTTPIPSPNITNGDSVWAELGNKPTATITGTQDKRNLFNLSDGTNLQKVQGSNKDDVFSVSRDAQVGTLTGGAGTDTLLWQVGNIKASNDIVSVTIDTGTGLATADDLEYRQEIPGQPTKTGIQLQQFSLSGIENYSISAKGSVVIHAETDTSNDLFDVNILDGAGVDSFGAPRHSELYGGTGTNTFVLNNHTEVYSRSNDLFLWNAGVSAYIQLSPTTANTANGTKITKLPVNTQPQAIFIELPCSYADLQVKRIGFSLILETLDGHTLEIDKVFNWKGDPQKQKVLQFRDRDGCQFSLNIPDGFSQEVSLADMPKVFSFRNTDASMRDATHVLHLHGDTAANTYNFEDASGYFSIEPQTSQSMTLLLNTDATSITYSFAANGTLTLTHTSLADPTQPKSATNPEKTLTLSIPNYASVKDQLHFYANTPTTLPAAGSTTAQGHSALAQLTLPTTGSGTLGSSHIVKLDDDASTGVPTVPNDEDVNALCSLNLSGSTSHHWVCNAAQAANLQISVLSSGNHRAIYLKQGNDLIVFDADKLDNTYGLLSTTSLTIKGYFASAVPSSLNVNGTTISAATIATAVTQVATLLPNMPTVSVFRNDESSTRDATHVLHLQGGTVANIYNFEDASGYFSIEPQTLQPMTLLLSTDVTGITYSFANGTLTLTHTSLTDPTQPKSATNPEKTLALSIPNYVSVKDRLRFYANTPVAGGTIAQWTQLTLPTTGSGTLSSSNIVKPGADTSTGVPTVPNDEDITLNLSGSTSHHWVCNAAQAANLQISILSGADNKATYLRQGNDLIVFDAGKLDKTYGLLSTTSLTIKEYFVSTAPSSLNINGTTITAAAIATATTSYIGTEQGDDITTYTGMYGGNGADNYHIDMTSGKSVTINNAATDGVYDTLTLDGITDIHDLTLTLNGSDLVLGKKNSTATVTLSNYEQDAEHQHLSLRINNGASPLYVLPVTVGSGLDVYMVDPDPQRAGQRVHIFDFSSTKSNVINIGEGAGPNTVIIDLSDDVATYTKEVIGNDLQLTKAGAPSIYVSNYYNYPRAATFSWGSGQHDSGVETVLPDNYHTDLLNVGVPREKLVRYVNAGLTAPEDAVQALAFQNNHYLTPIATNEEIIGKMTNGEGITAYLPLTFSAFGDITLLSMYSNRDNGAGTGFQFDIRRSTTDNQLGDLVLRYSNKGNVSDVVELKKGFVSLGEKTAFLFAYDPSNNAFNIWKQTGYSGSNGLKSYAPCYTGNLDQAFANAWKEGATLISNQKAPDDRRSSFYTGNPADLLTNIGDSQAEQLAKIGAVFSTLGIDAFTAPTSSTAVAKGIYRLEGVPGLTEVTINELVDEQHLTSQDQIHKAVTYLNKGVMRAALIGAIVTYNNQTSIPDTQKIVADTIDVKLVNYLLAQRATKESQGTVAEQNAAKTETVAFVLNALTAKLSLLEAALYLQAGVTDTEINQIKTVLETGKFSAGSSTVALMKKALLIQGYNNSTADTLAPILLQTGIRAQSQVTAFFDAGYTDATSIANYIKAGVSAADLQAGNQNHDRYNTGDRRNLITITASDSLTQPVHSYSYYLTQEIVGRNKDSNGNYVKLEPGQLLDAGMINDSSLISSGAVKKVDNGLVQQSRGQSTLNNLVDNHVQEGDAWAWAWKSPVDPTDSTKETKLHLDGDNNWIEFDLKDKVALTEITLQGKGGDGTTINLKAQAKDNQGLWHDVSGTAWTAWTPSGDSTRTLTLDTGTMPYDDYRIAIQQGDLPTQFWLEEATFTSKAIPLIQAMASLSGASGGDTEKSSSVPGAIQNPPLVAGSH